MSGQFTLEFHGLVHLSIDEIWPDGDAPENPTTEDVLEVIESQGLNAYTLLEEWNLKDYLHVEIIGGGEGGGKTLTFR